MLYQNLMIIGVCVFFVLSLLSAGLAIKYRKEEDTVRALGVAAMVLFVIALCGFSITITNIREQEKEEQKNVMLQKR
jgi:purine-cytosine permease-like protein